MKVALLGFDVEGRASYDYFKASGDDITICDQNPDLQVPDGVAAQLGEGYLDNLNTFDLLARTPGLHPEQILEKNPNVASKITTGTNEFFRACPTRNVIGITGTKGKGTTSTLITEMLEATGKKVYLGGNIGTPALSFLADVNPDDWVVLELSNFQLIDLHYSPHYAVCLMIVPEHLNWHPDMAEYMAAKSNLFAHQTPEDTTVYYAANDDTVDVANSGKGQKVPFYTPPGAAIDNGIITIAGQEVCRTDELKLLGEHNWQNACAATTVIWEALHEEMVHEHLVAAMRSVLTTFSGLEHRLEFVRELKGVQYYDDSFGTTPETAIVAIQAFAQPKILILGGSDKGAQYTELAQVVHENSIRKVLLIGDQAARIQTALDAAGFSNYQPGGNTMSEIIANAQASAQPGDVVLLSTGCASFGMFENYKDRGNQFKATVQALA
ncbi:MAG TPA: UDP-N-acetylmuramoyl-L-alanine--D-glutamate ligase [Candidatus Microsaccharimonas sp.]|nr:UDP-N-acetylmuramoyl-L-alanine--D-glutamate ligase [Candidatus Microsaccharimonas sp.]